MALFDMLMQAMASGGQQNMPPPPSEVSDGVANATAPPQPFNNPLAGLIRSVNLDPPVAPEGMQETTNPPAPNRSLSEILGGLFSGSTPANASSPKAAAALVGPAGVVDPLAGVTGPGQMPSQAPAATGGPAPAFGGVPIATGMRPDGAMAAPASRPMPPTSAPGPQGGGKFLGMNGNDLRDILMATLAGAGNVRPGAGKWGAALQGASGATQFIANREAQAKKDAVAADERNWKRSMDVSKEGRDERRISISEQEAKRKAETDKINRIKTMKSIIIDDIKSSPEYLNAKSAQERMKVVSQATNARFSGTSASAADRKQFAEEADARLQIESGKESNKYTMGNSGVMFPRSGKVGNGSEEDPIRTLDKKVIEKLPKGSYFYNPADGRLVGPTK